MQRRGTCVSEARHVTHLLPGTIPRASGRLPRRTSMELQQGTPALLLCDAELLDVGKASGLSDVEADAELLEVGGGNGAGRPAASEDVAAGEPRWRGSVAGEDRVLGGERMGGEGDL